MSRYWYFYDGTGPATDPTNYAQLGISVEECDQGHIPCAIYAHPSSISNRATPLAADLASGSSIRNYFGAAISISLDHYPIFPDKPYVYFRSNA